MVCEGILRTLRMRRRAQVGARLTLRNGAELGIEWGVGGRRLCVEVRVGLALMFILHRTRCQRVQMLGAGPLGYVAHLSFNNDRKCNPLPS